MWREEVNGVKNFVQTARNVVRAVAVLMFTVRGGCHLLDNGEISIVNLHETILVVLHGLSIDLV